MARRYKLPGTEVHIASIPGADGRFRNAEYRAYEAVMARGVVRAAQAAALERFDALAIGCFYDVALHDAREMSGEMIVTASCEASCEIASTLANRFGVIVGWQKWVHQMQAKIGRASCRERGEISEVGGGSKEQDRVDGSDRM